MRAGFVLFDAVLSDQQGGVDVRRWTFLRFGLCSLVVLCCWMPARAALTLESETLVQCGERDLTVIGYSVPSFVHWDGDGLADLVVGEGSGTYPAKVRVYLNEGLPGAPAFSTYHYVQAAGEDIELVGSSCLGLFPRVVYWDADDRKDLLIGQSDGLLRLYLNVGTDDDPVFDGGRFLQIGPPLGQTDLDVGYRATPMVVDYDNNGAKDLVVGDIYGVLHLYINTGPNDAPYFMVAGSITDNGTSLVVPGGRSSPFVIDLDGDGNKDLLTGNTLGQLLFYANTGTDSEPAYSGYELVAAGGQTIDYPGYARTRPFVCDWDEDGLLDVLMGASDGRVHLCRGAPGSADFDVDGDVDQADFSLFYRCMFGPAEGLLRECVVTDLTDDSYNTLEDFAVFQRSYSGPR